MESGGDKMPPETKRRKIEPPSLRRAGSSSAAKRTRDAMSAHGVDIRIQQAKNSAVAQAQQEGCPGNYRIFDSPFENFLIPVVPTRAELAG